MDGLFSSGVEEYASAYDCGADPGVRVPTFVYAASNQAALLWRDNIDWTRAMNEEVAEELTVQPFQYTLYDISTLLERIGKARSNVIAYCYECDVKWSFWDDQECWMCGEIGYLYTPRNIRSITKYGMDQL